ncbi:MAG: phage/plasmid primase, P4 family [Dehalococcoidia bacterium]|jgi:putative DNA primase/helicase
MNPSTLTEALAYADRGWRVFPTDGKIPFAGTHGFKDATSDKAIVLNWWQQRPDANVAGATGPAFGLAIDVDAKNGGDESLRDLQREHGELPPTPTSHTGGGGLHLIFAYPELADGETIKNEVGIAPGIDVRAEGGYIVLPPSLHISGRRYVWDVENGPDTPMAPLPDWLRAMVVTRADNGHRPAEPIGDIIPNGERDKTLISLAGTMQRRGFSEESILAALRVENGRCETPLADAQVREKVRSIVRYPPTSTAAGPTHLTDTGNAERFRRQHGENARWCDALGGWLLWNGQRWRPDTSGRVLELAKTTALTIYSEVAGASSEDGRKAIAKWAIASESQARLDAMLNLARSLLPAEVEDFDADPWLLNVENGTIDLHSGEIREPQRGDMITMQAPVTYDPDAEDDVLDRFLNDVTGGDAELAAYLQRAIGYSLSGDTREEVLFLVLGPTATGKSTLLESVGEMMGDYALKLPIDTFLQRRDFGAARPDIARLRGARFVLALEAGKGRHLDEPAVKEIVGGDTVSARFLYHDLITFRPVCKLWLGSNFAPEMNNLDSAIWRRVRRIPFERSFGDKPDPTIKLHLRHDPQARSALLAWAIRGLLDWQRDGLGRADIVDVRTSELRAEMNPIREFVDARCILGSGKVAGAKELRAAYEAWAKGSGAKPIDNKDWGLQLRELGCKTDRQRADGKQHTTWVGIGILADGE